MHQIRRLQSFFALSISPFLAASNGYYGASSSPSAAMIAQAEGGNKHLAADWVGAAPGGAARLAIPFTVSTKQLYSASNVKRGSDLADMFLTNPASASGSHLYNKVLLQSGMPWPSIANITVPGGKAIIARGTITSSTVGPVNVKGAKWALYSEDTSVIRNLKVSNFKVTEAEREGIRLRGDVKGVEIRNFSILKSDKPSSGPEIPIGIHAIEGQNILVADGYIGGFRMQYAEGEYTNGDGLASERGVSGLTLRNVVANDNSDGGYDLKSAKTFLFDTLAERNGWNYRFWDNVDAATIYSVDPTKAHIWVGAGAVVEIDHLVARSKGPVFVIWAEPTAKKIVIRSCDLDVQNAKMFFKGSEKTRLELGPGCTLSDE